MILKRVIFSSILSTVALCTNVLCMNNSAHDELTSGNNLPRPFAEKCTESISTVVREEDPKLFRELAPTLALMKMLLRENFKPLPEGLRDNVVEFFSSPEFTPHNCMGDQEIILDDNLTNILCRLILLEQKESLNGNVVLWHGLPGEALFTYKYYAYLFSRLTGQDVGSFILRGDHFYAKNPKTGEIFKTLHEVREAYGIQEIIDHGSDGDYTKGIDISTIHCNIALSVGPNVSRSTASSVGFFCNSFCGGEFSIFDVVCSTLLFQGMSLIEAKRSAKQVEGLFKKTFLVDHEKNGGILGISLPRNVVDDLALHVQMGGREYDPFVRMVIKGIKAIFGKKSLERHIIESSLSAIYSHKKGASVDEIISEIEKIFWTSLPEEKSHELKKLLESYLSSRSQKDSSITNLLENIQMALSQNLTNDEICDLTNEIALYLNPEIRQKVFGTFRHPLNPEQEALFDAELRALVDSHVALIAASKTKPFENAFLIKRSKEMEESADARYQIEAVPFLIERNLITEAQKAIKQYPNFEQNEEIIRLLVGRTLFSFHRGFNEVLETVEKIFGKPIFSFIHPDHLPLILRGYADSRYFIEFFNYLIKHDVKLDDKLFAGLLASVFYSKDCLKNAFEKRKINQGIIEDVLFQNDGIYISVENIVYLMQQGFSFNPNEEIGKKHLKSWLKICRKNENLITSIANIIDFYKLNPSEHKDLYLFLASEAASRGGTWEYHDGIKSLGSCSPIPGGYKVKISDLETDISLDDLGSMPSFNINVNMSSNDHIFVSEFLSKKLGRQYPAELIKAFCELKSTYSFFRNISSEIPETHTWLNAFMRAKTLSEVEKLVYELDNLDILFLNLKLLDENPEVKHIIDTEITAQENSNKIITSEQEKAKREVWVNSWFTNIIAKYKTYYTRVELQLAELASLSQQEQMEIGENVKKAPLSLALGIFERFPQLGLDVRFHISSRIWNFDANKLMKYQYYGQQLREPERQYTTDFFENEIKLHPNILNNAELVFRLFINNALPQSVLNDTGKMAELFLSQSPQRQLCLVNIMSESDNKTLRDFTRDMIMRVFYPGTNIFVRDAFAIFASYGIGREDELP